MHVASWRWAYEGLLPAAVLDGLSVDERAAMWQRILADPVGVTLLAERSGRAIGFASAGPGRDEIGGPSVGELYALYVLAEVAGTGVGWSLHDAVLSQLAERGFVEARLWVLRGNLRAIRFYSRQGWRADGVERDERRSDGVVLTEVRLSRRWGQT